VLTQSALPGLTTIEQPDDPRIDSYRAVRERDLTGRDGRFIIEGEVVLRLALRERPHLIESLLLAETRVAPFGDLLREIRAAFPVYIASRAVMDRIAGFPIHRGVLAVGRRVVVAPDDLLARLPSRALVVGLVGLANHDNVGGVFRNAAAFGADAVLLDRTSCDPLYRKAIRVSVGAVLTTPFARGGDAEAMLDGLVEAGFAVTALSPGGSERLDEVDWQARHAILLGAEGAGLPPGVIERVRTVSIKMAPGFDSLNVATASGIALHAARRM
jgi:tRNA G18 (ribose-2'-O)-methylase SpoU